ncbi:MAG: ABC-2 family transporter protein [bacterium]
MRCYLALLGASVRSQMAYRGNFLLQTFTALFQTVIEIAGIWALFARFGTLRGWALPEVALLYGIVNVGFALAESVGRGFDDFHNLVKTGEFDRVLLRPRGTALQIAGRELRLRPLGRLAQGLAVLLWAAAHAGVAWTAGRAALALGAILGGAALFYGLVVLQATMSFWTVEAIELWNTVTYGGVETGQYPVAVYRPWFRRFFTYVVPLAAVTYFPAVAILGRTDPLGSSPLFQDFSPLLGIAFMIAALQVWRFGVRRYRSTGS